jgi:hypothetical protein
MESTIPVTIAAAVLFTALPTAAVLWLWLAQSKRRKG